jgi:hypothetical protein
MKSPYSPELSGLCETRLDEITKADSANLTEFAECRLVALGVSPSHGEDMSQRAFQQVLQGLETDQGGRRPCLEDLVDKPAFLNYLRGVISSLIYGMTSKCGFRTTHKAWEDEMLTPSGGGPSPAKEAELNDIRDQLFRGLRAHAPRRWLRSINEWEPVFVYSDRIPSRGHRKYAREIKRRARKVLSDLGGIR